MLSTFFEKSQILSQLMNNADYVSFVEMLKNHPENLIDIFRTGNPETGNDVIKIVTQSIPVKQLKATQNEIGLIDSLLFVLNPSKASNGKIVNMPMFIIDILNATPNTILRPLNIDIVVSGNNIIDGHHRWSTIALLNPHSKISTLNITGSPNTQHALKSIQAAIFTTKGKIFSSPIRGPNILTANDNVIIDFILDNISPVVSKGLQKYWNITENDVVKKLSYIILSNLRKIKKINVDNTYNIGRSSMPQTDKYGEWHNVLSRGIINVNYPFGGGLNISKRKSFRRKKVSFRKSRKNFRRKKASFRKYRKSFMY